MTYNYEKKELYLYLLHEGLRTAAEKLKFSEKTFADQTEFEFAEWLYYAGIEALIAEEEKREREEEEPINSTFSPFIMRKKDGKD